MIIATAHKIVDQGHTMHVEEEDKNSSVEMGIKGSATALRMEELDGDLIFPTTMIPDLIEVLTAIYTKKGVKK